MKKPRWFQRQSRKELSDTKSEDIKKIRQQTDQRMKQQGVPKSPRDAAASRGTDGVRRDQ